MHPLIGTVVHEFADSQQREISGSEVLEIFKEKWLKTKWPLNVLEITETELDGNQKEVETKRYRKM